jgi:hypothetical protein
MAAIGSYFIRYSSATNPIFVNTPLSSTMRTTKSGDVVGVGTCNLAVGSPPANSTAFDVNLGTIANQPVQRCYSLLHSTVGAGKHPIIFIFTGGTDINTTGGENSFFTSFINTSLAQGYDLGFIARDKYTNGTYAIQASQPNIALINASLDDAINNHNVDSTRVYALGFSVGGNVPLYFACYVSSRTTAVVSLGSSHHGPAADPTSTGYTPCTQPSRPVSVMFIQADGDAFAGDIINPDNSKSPDPYQLHTPPLSASDIAEAQSAPSNVNHYSTLHASEGWASWFGCANNRSSSQSNIGGVTGTIYKWINCQDASSGNTGEIIAYEMPGTHGGNEFNPVNNGDVLSFFGRHVASASSQPKTGDINGDNSVNITDLSIILSSYGQTTTACVTNSAYTCDINTSGASAGIVDIFDLSVLLSNYGS